MTVRYSPACRSAWARFTPATGWRPGSGLQVTVLTVRPADRHSAPYTVEFGGVAIIGDMLELGQNGSAFHRGLADAVVTNGIDLVFCCGPLMNELWQALPANRRGGYAEDAAALEAQLLPAIRAGDVIMVKGSLGSRMAPIVKALQRAYPRHTMEDAPVQG